MLGIIISVLVGIGGMIGTIIVAANILSEVDRNYYTYSAPYTEHEIGMFVTLIVFAVIMFLGIAGVIFSIIRMKNKRKLKKLQAFSQGDERRSSIGVICPKCGLNVASTTQVCPKCGYKFIEKR